MQDRAACSGRARMSNRELHLPSAIIHTSSRVRQGARSGSSGGRAGGLLPDCVQASRQRELARIYRMPLAFLAGQPEDMHMQFEYMQACKVVGSLHILGTCKKASCQGRQTYIPARRDLQACGHLAFHANLEIDLACFLSGFLSGLRLSPSRATSMHQSHHNAGKRD